MASFLSPLMLELNPWAFGCSYLFYVVRLGHFPDLYSLHNLHPEKEYIHTGLTFPFFNFSMNVKNIRRFIILFIISLNLLHYFTVYVHPATFLSVLCFEPASPNCIEGGGGNCVRMYSNKYSIDFYKAAPKSWAGTFEYCVSNFRYILVEI